jgi:outer membrane protein OmpA-like peptidoglycan-associated protein
MKSYLLLSLPLVLSASVAMGCRGQTSRETPIFGIRNMYNQERYNIQAESDYFDDKRTMRPLPEGVVARDNLADTRLTSGRLEDQSGYVLTIPREAVDAAGGMSVLLKRGQERYNIYCALCHSQTGNGNGVVTQRAVAGGAIAFQPANLHADRLRHIPDGQLFATISNGKGNMAGYAHSIPVADRWAIVAYVRALQLAQPLVAGEKAPEVVPPPVAAPVHHVEVLGDHVVITQKIEFDTAKAHIADKSHDLLDEIAGVFKANPQIKKVEIQGFTDASGDKAANVKLSSDRAAAVSAALIERGLPKTMFVTKGFGPDKPIADNATEDGKDKNRRVEFVITDPPAKH